MVEKLIDADVEDIIECEDHLICITPADDYHRVLHYLESHHIEVEQSNLAMRASTLIEVHGEVAESLEKLIDALEDLDDVQNVYFNAEFCE